MRRLLTCLACSVAVVSAAPTAPRLDEWPQFRGPGGNGVADDAVLPEHWTTTDNIAWTTEIPGHGWSSPILWHGRVFVTSAISPGAFKAPSTGIFGNDFAAELEKQGLSDEEITKRVVGRDIELTAETGEISYLVYALDAQTGAVLWKQQAHRSKPFGGRHRKNTYASETPVTDGERLYPCCGNVGVFAFSMDGSTALVPPLDAAADLSRFRHGVLACGPRDGSISCTTTTASRS